jgi:hypothetical protein
MWAPTPHAPAGRSARSAPVRPHASSFGPRRPVRPPVRPPVAHLLPTRWPAGPPACRLPTGPTSARRPVCSPALLYAGPSVASPSARRAHHAGSPARHRPSTPAHSPTRERERPTSTERLRRAPCSARAAVAARAVAPSSASRKMRRMRELEEEEQRRLREPCTKEHKRDVSNADALRARSAGSRSGLRDARLLGAAPRGAREPAGRGWMQWWRAHWRPAWHIHTWDRGTIYCGRAACGRSLGGAGSDFAAQWLRAGRTGAGGSPGSSRREMLPSYSIEL